MNLQTDQGQRYIKQLDAMLLNRKRWTQANPEKEVKIQFNYQKKVFVISPISDAVAKKLVVANEAGIELLKALWPWDDTYEPTVFMVKLVLEAEE